MKLNRLEHNGIYFLAREGNSDEKTFDEVIVRNCYEKKDFKITKGEKWIDLGGNVGAFAVNAISKGAKVDIYEPDPFNCKMIERNLRLNGLDANIFQKAVVTTGDKVVKMYVGNKNQSWRNSIHKNWGNQSFNVPTIHYTDVLSDSVCCKMDIEGAEIPIIEKINPSLLPNKMVFEWSLDINPQMKRYRLAIDKMRSNYKKVYHSKQFYEMPDERLPSSIFPKADNIYCL